jgi:RimJ/RimL family protein N-acetyltransferase
VTHVPTDLELMHIEVDTIWERDGRGRLTHARRPDRPRAPHAVIVRAAEGEASFVGAHVADDLALQLEQIPHEPEPASNANAVPPAVSASAALLEPALGRVEITSGPTYLIPRGVTFDSPATIRRSTDPDAHALIASAPPEANWEPEEWRDLIEGRLGPWAMALIDGRAVSICHSARLAPHGAEAGTWTHPEHRGHGHAAAATAAWAALLADSGKHLFYSTSAENRSSQRVAARLGLREIGCTWRIGPPAASG